MRTIAIEAHCFKKALSLALLIGLGCFGCAVETNIDSTALLSCHQPGDCPSGWTCDLQDSLCHLPGDPKKEDTASSEEDAGKNADDTDSSMGGDTGGTGEAVYRYEDKRDICQAIWTKAQDCESELQETLGEEDAALFGLPMDSFVADVCIPEQLDGATDADLDSFLGQLEMVQALPCNLFIATVVAQ